MCVYLSTPLHSPSSLTPTKIDPNTFLSNFANDYITLPINRSYMYFSALVLDQVSDAYERTGIRITLENLNLFFLGMRCP